MKQKNNYKKISKRKSNGKMKLINKKSSIKNYKNKLKN